MDAEALRKKVADLLITGGGRHAGGAFERGQGLPPYLTPGTHWLDELVKAEGLNDNGARVVLLKREAIEKFGFGGTIGDSAQPVDVAGTNALPSADDVHTLFTMAGALFPPYDPEVLTTVIEHSNALRPNIDAYKTNVDGFGYRLDPILDLERQDAKVDEAVGDAMYLDRLHESETRGDPVPAAVYPSAEEIGKKKIEIKALMRLERARIEQFFEHSGGDLSFKELRRRTREDYEATGNAYWEVVRDGAKRVSAFYLIPSYSMRLAPIEHVLHEVSRRVRVTPFRYEPRRIKRRFRRFIQIVLDRIVFFKEFGDPRVISKRTGRVWPNEDELAKNSSHDGPATEVIHFKNYSPRSPYGIPRWIGNLLSVLGSRASEEINYLYFDNKAVPPMALLVSGGKLSASSTEKIASYMQDNLRGKENFHRVMVIEAEPAGGQAQGIDKATGRIRLELVPLRDAQHDDALFQDYDQQNQDKIGNSFRVPRLLRGDTKDFNRATADAALQFAETQVFQGEREAFDDIINRTIFSELGIRFWRFVSNSPVNRDPMDLTKILDTLCQRGVLTVNEAREVAADVLNKPLQKLTEAWADVPAAFILAGLQPDAAGDLSQPAGAGAGGAPGKAAEGEPAAADQPSGKAPDGEPVPSDIDRRVLTIAGRLIALRDSLDRRAAAGYSAEADAASKAEGEITLQVPSDVFRSWFEPAA